MSVDTDLRGRSVVFALYYYAPYVSGLTIYIRRLAEDLARRGADVTVVASGHQPGLPRAEVIDGVRVLRSRPLIRIDKGVVAPGLLARAVRLGQRADAVIPVMPFAEAGVIASLVPRTRLLPVYVCDLRLGPGIASRIIEAAAARSARHAVRRARRHVVLSLEYAQASRVVGDLSDRAIAVPPPIDVNRFAHRSAKSLRDRLGIGDRQPVVGFVGRLVFEKGLPVLVEAMRAVRQRHPTAVLAIAGEGSAVAGEGVLKDLEREIQGDPNVVITGFLSDEDLLAFYSMCTVLALPSLDPLEAFGMVQVEAMLCGTPVVASALPGVAIPVRTSGMGLLATPGDPARLANALTRALDNPDVLRRPREEIEGAFDPAISYDAMAAAVTGVA